MKKGDSPSRQYRWATDEPLVGKGRSPFSEQAAGHRNDWKERLKKLETLDWSRANAGLWEGRAMNAGRLRNAASTSR